MFYSSDPTTELAATDATPDADTASVHEDDRELQVLSIVHGAQTRNDSQPRHQRASGAEPTPGTPPASAPQQNIDPHEAPLAPARVSQRSIAQALGMSVGLTNAILKRLTDKGFLMMRRINAHNVHYLVTPAGVEHISRRSYLYLRRTIGHVVRYKERLRAFCHAQRDHGNHEIVLIGESDLSFILEWCAEKEGLGFRHVEPEGSGSSTGSENGPDANRTGEEAIPPAHPAVLRVLSEHYPELPETGPSASAVLLHEVVLGLAQQAGDVHPHESSGLTDTRDSGDRAK